MLIAVPLDDERFTERVRKAKALGADLIELRVDLFNDPSLPAVKKKLELVKKEGLGTILTVRAPEEGGRELPNRGELIRELGPLSDYTDLELRRRSELVVYGPLIRQAGKKLIVSYHDFERTPPSWILKELFREGKRYGGIPKVAVKANGLEDAARLLCVAREVPGEKIAIAMGQEGVVTRVAGFAFGSVISYASLDKATAPGQLPLEELVRLRELFYGAAFKRA
ncbi:MAG: type I 3-dehydroquinate dehydratase [Aquificae bacterium]|nr:type I 3-dehydroquinate dehydratase [Aquificota bacterium]